METLIRFQCWGSSPEDGGGERQRDLMMGLGRCMCVRKRDEETSGSFKVRVNFCVGVYAG